MRLAIGAMVCWLLALGPLGAAALDFGRYHALVIGIDAYPDLPPLATAVNDASAVHDLLIRDYGYESTLLLNPTREKLMLAFDRLRADLTEEDNLLIFYAGHGFLDRQTGDGFWLPLDAKPDSQVAWVSVSTITHFLKATAAKHVLIVADSCYSGTLTREAPAVLATGAARAAELERISAKRARKALTSGGLEPVADGGGDGHSVFTRAFIETLKENDEVLDGHQLFHELRGKVVLNAEQTPQYSDVRLTGDEGGDFLFVRKGAKLTAAQPAGATADRSALDLAFWEGVKDSADPAAFEAYLAEFPDGTFAGLARLKLKGLKADAAPASRASPPAPAPPPTQVATATPAPTRVATPAPPPPQTAKPAPMPVQAATPVPPTPRPAPQVAMQAPTQPAPPRPATGGSLDGAWLLHLSLFGYDARPFPGNREIVIANGFYHERFRAGPGQYELTVEVGGGTVRFSGLILTSPDAVARRFSHEAPVTGGDLTARFATQAASAAPARAAPSKLEVVLTLKRK